MKLSKRLSAVAAFVPEHARLADIGSDHAKLPLSLLERGQIEFAIAGEVVRGPFEIAQAATAATDKIIVRLADGLSAFTAADRIDTLVIAGMGGLLIRDILAADAKKAASVKRLILQANNEEEALRRWLTARHFAIVAEELVEDKGKIYDILVAEVGAQQLTENQLRFGLQQDSPIFQDKWQRRLDEIDKVLVLLPEKETQQRTRLTDEKRQILEVLR